jgi:hypothetical protein
MSDSELPKLDFTFLDENKQREYQKIYNDSIEHLNNIGFFDKLSICVFCQTPISPRSITKIVKKECVTNNELSKFDTSCNNCAKLVASYVFLGSSSESQKKSPEENVSPFTPRKLSNSDKTLKKVHNPSPLSTARSVADSSSEE